MVYPAVTHIETLLVFAVDNLLVLAPGAGIGVQRMSAYILQLGGHGEGQLARWVGVASEYGCQGVACL